MGELLSLADHRRAHPLEGGPRAAVTLAFHLGSPYTYLVAERADRMVDGLDWQPVLVPALGRPAASKAGRDGRRRARPPSTSRSCGPSTTRRRPGCDARGRLRRRAGERPGLRARRDAPDVLRRLRPRRARRPGRGGRRREPAPGRLPGRRHRPGPRRAAARRGSPAGGPRRRPPPGAPGRAPRLLRRAPPGRGGRRRARDAWELQRRRSGAR